MEDLRGDSFAFVVCRGVVLHKTVGECQRAQGDRSAGVEAALTSITDLYTASPDVHDDSFFHRHLVQGPDGIVVCLALSIRDSESDANDENSGVRRLADRAGGDGKYRTRPHTVEESLEEAKGREPTGHGRLAHALICHTLAKTYALANLIHEPMRVSRNGLHHDQAVCGRCVHAWSSLPLDAAAS